MLLVPERRQFGQDKRFRAYLYASPDDPARWRTVSRKWQNAARENQGGGNGSNQREQKYPQVTYCYGASRAWRNQDAIEPLAKARRAGLAEAQLFVTPMVTLDVTPSKAFCCNLLILWRERRDLNPRPPA
jgi:hypothetical protein